MAKKTTKQEPSGMTTASGSATAAPMPPLDMTKKMVGSVAIARPQIGLIDIPIIGLSPLVLHAWSQKARLKMLASQQVESGTRAKVPREKRDPVADYEGARYVVRSGKEEWDGCPAVAFKGALVGACRQVAGLAMTDARRMIFVRYDGVTHYLSPHSCKTEIGLVRIYGEPEMREDTARNSDGGTDLRFRPQYWPWEAMLHIEFNAARLSADAIVSLVAMAGAFEGVGEWRPGSKESNTGQFGRWKLDDSKVMAGGML